jgi:ABC-type multidrug transport system fused ATPase/permease subunit
MNDYSIALFLHIAGALGFFAGLGLEWISLRQLQRATTVEQVREWVRLPDEMSRPAMLSMLVLILAGVYMMVTVWGEVAWIIVTLGSFVPMMFLAMGITTRRMKAIKRKLEVEHASPSPALRDMLSQMSLRLSIQTRVTMAVGIVFLMTIKPNLVESIITMTVATVLGVLWSVLVIPRRRVHEESLVS